MKCATCQRKLDQGDDVLQLEEGVIGLQGIVPLEKEALFCSVECLKNYFNGSKGHLHTMPRRIP